MPAGVRRRRALTDARGATVCTYALGDRAGLPWARDLRDVVGDPTEAILAGLSGWAVSAPVDVGERLLAAGARPLRKAHRMDLDPAAAPPERGAAPPVEGVRLVPCDRGAGALLPAVLAAYPPGHPDHPADQDEASRLALTADLLAGSILGPLSREASGLAVDAGDRVVAGVLVFMAEPGLAWIGDVFKDPARGPRGVGALLLRRAAAVLAGQGVPVLGLAVTEGNPARGLYERLGFTTVSTSWTVAVP
ncbi:GNAT family N-acetyltransferase [Actinorugispora endophytica]|uniref:Acetyltransferase (GNAT) family protein n=1 Tax=Actinorugispora endophytica TaxID=1605990 RepID=A0A4R6UKT6_9ACTN|nr:GNAT family N-acetyltransferase [Actinorugispora endophytica]TDQ45953.1 acetyltransferase (GNAT) family protein [Actinorugispora endophytica]